MIERTYDRHVGVDYDGFDCALVLTVWDDAVENVSRTVRIPVENIPEFLRDVTGRGTQALATAARRIEVGHCETCGNTGLIDVEQRGRTERVECPDCRDRWPSEPFKAAPHIGRRG